MRPHPSTVQETQTQRSQRPKLLGTVCFTHVLYFLEGVVSGIWVSFIALRIAETFGYKHLSAGDLLREERHVAHIAVF